MNQCEHCETIFSCQSALTNHQRTTKYCLTLRNVPSQNIKTHDCDYCEYSTTRKCDFIRHTKTCKYKTTSEQNGQDDIKIKCLLLEQKLALRDEQIAKLEITITNILKNTTRRKTIHKLIKYQVWFKDCGEVFEGSCQICSKKLKFHESSWNTSHKISHSQGGPDTLHNLTILCNDCNLSIGSMSVDEYRTRYISQNTGRTQDIAQA